MGAQKNTGAAVPPILVIGAGLAGCEAAWAIAQAGIPAALADMKPAALFPRPPAGGLRRAGVFQFPQGQAAGQRRRPP